MVNILNKLDVKTEKVKNEITELNAIIKNLKEHEK
jgi:hypothetical protein